MGNWFSSSLYSINNASLEFLHTELKGRIIGQEESIEAACRVLQTEAPNYTNSPFCVMAFTGPSGVGKTPFAKIIAKQIYNSEFNFFPIDLSVRYCLKPTITNIATENKDVGGVIMLNNILSASPANLRIIENKLIRSWKLNFKKFIVILNLTSQKALHSVDSIPFLCKATKDRIQPNMIHFQPLDIIFAQQIIVKEWQRISSEKLTVDELQQTVLDCFDKINGWNTENKLIPYLLRLDALKTLNPQSNSCSSTKRVAFEEGQSSRKRKLEDGASGGANKKLTSDHNSPTFSNSNANTATHDQSDNTNTHNSVNDSNINSNNTVQSPCTHTIQDQAPISSPANSGTSQVLDPFDLEKIPNKLTGLFIPPDSLHTNSSTTMQRGISLPFGEGEFTIVKSKFGGKVLFMKEYLVGEILIPHYMRITKDNKIDSTTHERDPTTQFQLFKYKKGIAVKTPCNKYIGYDANGFCFKTEPCELHFDMSFAPIREVNVRFFIDGADYFQEIYHKISNAKKCIYIADWMFSPQIHLVRPASQPEHQLSYLLQKKAKEGVLIRILVFGSFEACTGTGNAAAAAELSNIPNLEIAEQLGNFSKASRWSHHQKCVIVDFEIAYLGGLDLAANRWDTPEHSVIERIEGHFPGDDYRNPNILFINRDHHARMPWHDVQIFVDGAAANDVQFNFVQRWNITCPKTQLKYIPNTTEPGPTACKISRSMQGDYCGELYDERSVLLEILDAIENSQTFIYIESQYFIDCAKNQAFLNALKSRILLAHKKKEQFHVVAILPQFPDNGAVDSSGAHLVMQHQYQSVKKLLTEIEKETKKKKEYIQFFALRNYGRLTKDNVVTEQIYVHSKILITDNRVIVGSANINDRSLSGTKDTELCATVYSQEKSRELLEPLLCEHSGFNEAIPDIVQFFKGKWIEIAKKNTKIFRSVFGYTIPEGSPTTFHDYATACKKGVDVTNEEWKQLLQVQGHLVLFPHKFLQDEMQETTFAQKFLDFLEFCK